MGARGDLSSNAQTPLFQVGRGVQTEIPQVLGLLDLLVQKFGCVVSPQYLSADARALLGVCLQPKSRDRPSSAELLSNPFLAMTGGGNVDRRVEALLGGEGPLGVSGGAPPTGVCSDEVPTALLHLLASLHVHLEGGGHAVVTGGGGQERVVTVEKGMAREMWARGGCVGEMRRLRNLRRQETLEIA